VSRGSDQYWTMDYVAQTTSRM